MKVLREEIVIVTEYLQSKFLGKNLLTNLPYFEENNFMLDIQETLDLSYRQSIAEIKKRGVK